MVGFHLSFRLGRCERVRPRFALQPESILLARRRIALLKFPTREKEWHDSSWRIVTNLEAELTPNARDPPMIWHPNHPQHILRNGCR